MKKPWPKSGDKLVFKSAEGNFYPHFANVIEFAKKNLIVGQICTVRKCEVYSSWCAVWLEEIEGDHCFHLSMFMWCPENNPEQKIKELDQISDFGAESFSITSEEGIFGLQRWADKQYMLSFFPTDVKGNRLQYHQSGIDKVYDLFLTEEQVEVIVEEYNKKKND